MDWIQAEKKYLFQTYKRQPLVLVKARGSWAWDAAGKKYLDFFSVLGVNNLGHCPAPVARAVRSQVGTLIHASNLYYTIPQIQCAEALVERTFPGRVFFCNSGDEANEAAVKLARRWGKRNGSDRHEIIAFENSFHGRTLAALTLTGQEKYRKGFDPLVEKVSYAALNDLASVERLLTPGTCAIFIEPVQGEGGVRPASREFLRALRALCDRRGLLLVFDEVQCGLGRSGRLFSFQHFGVRPDVVAVAKGLGGGLPIGAVLATDEAAACFGPGDHASTFGGNPVVCVAAAQVLKAMDERLLAGVRKKSALLFARLNSLQRKMPGLIRDVRGVGLMIGVELSVSGDPAVDFCREHGLLVNCTQGTVLRLLPPLTVSEAEIKKALGIFERALSAMVSKGFGTIKKS